MASSHEHISSPARVGGRREMPGLRVMSVPAFRGVAPILPTPFTAEDAVDFESLTALVDFSASLGVCAIGTPAFGSEFYKLDEGERTAVLARVISRAAGRVAVIAQCNHHSPRKAARLAQEAERMGAAAVNVALPRAFPGSPRDLLAYARAVCEAVSLPVVVQDWNPSGEPVGLQFVTTLHKQCPNFRYLKREDPGIGPLIRAISQETNGEVGVFLGWGGMYVPELHASGACGVMPGLGLADVFVRIWRLADEQRWAEAHGLFARIAPYVQFSLQTFEQFHHAEKHLLMARGVLRSATVRAVTIELNSDARRYLDLLIEQMQPLFEQAPPGR